MSRGGGENRSIGVLKFLDAYEKQEILWNPEKETYKNKHSRDEAYLNLIKDLNIPNLTINDIKLKVKSIRTTYTKELRAVTKQKDEGKPYNPKLFWFHRAHSFLKNVSLSRDNKRSTVYNNKMDEDYKPCVMDYEQITHNVTVISGLGNQTTDGHNSDSNTTYEYKAPMETQIPEDIGIITTSAQIMSNNCSNMKFTTAAINNHNNNNTFNGNSQSTNDTERSSWSISQLQTSAIHNSTSHNGIDNFSLTSNNNINNNNNNHNNQLSSSSVSPNPPSDDEYEIFCRSVAVQLRNINDNYSRSLAKLRIQQILFEAETGHLRNNNNNINNSISLTSPSMSTAAIIPTSKI